MYRYVSAHSGPSLMIENPLQDQHHCAATSNHGHGGSTPKPSTTSKRSGHRGAMVARKQSQVDEDDAVSAEEGREKFQRKQHHDKRGSAIACFQNLVKKRSLQAFDPFLGIGIFCDDINGTVHRLQRHLRYPVTLTTEISSHKSIGTYCSFRDIFDLQVDVVDQRSAKAIDKPGEEIARQGEMQTKSQAKKKALQLRKTAVAASNEANAQLKQEKKLRNSLLSKEIDKESSEMAEAKEDLSSSEDEHDEDCRRQTRHSLVEERLQNLTSQSDTIKSVDSSPSRKGVYPGRLDRIKQGGSSSTSGGIGARLRRASHMM